MNNIEHEQDLIIVANLRHFPVELICFYASKSVLGFCMPYIFFFLIFFSIIIMLSGDIEPNPGPRHVKSKSLTVCHRNLNSVWVDYFKN